MPSATRLRWAIFWKGIAVICVAVAVGATVLLMTHPEARPKPTDSGDGLGLLIGFALWPLILVWFVVWRTIIR